MQNKASQDRQWASKEPQASLEQQTTMMFFQLKIELNGWTSKKEYHDKTAWKTIIPLSASCFSSPS